MVGKKFDAILIDIFAHGSPIDKFEFTSELSAKIEPDENVKISNYIQKFVLVGDERNIVKVFVDGRQVK